MNRFEALVQGMKVDDQRYVRPADLGMDIKEFQDFADRLVGTGHVVGDANFIGSDPHRESESGNKYIDIVKVVRIL